ncbi:MFS transporter [Alicyclobacillus sp. SO9]|uniref:MFS transporter n=1 Tax=Alicyclobacillus sp. SO9 TaxID=2665646 RepID=UPI0018E7B02C|nr:MFS transporter [Alicyclobacillus sp. SO9]
MSSDTPLIHTVAKRLIVIRGLRSMGQGAMVVDLVLYLKDLHWNGTAIGGVTTGAGLFGAALILGVGILSDKFGRKRFLVTYEILTILAALTATLTNAALPLVIAIVVAGFGRGQNGGAGPFAPAEQAWLAHYITRSDRGRVFSYNAAVGFFGMAAGSIIGGWPSLSPATTVIGAFRPVFIFVGAISLVCFIVIWGTEEKRGQSAGANLQKASQYPAAPEGQVDSDEEADIRKKENRAMLKYASLNVLNGIAVGMTGPMMVYWFSLKFGAHTGGIGIMLSVGFLVTSLFSVLNARLARRVGVVRTVTVMRLTGSSLMALLPWLPNFGFASFVYIVRSGLNRGTMGNRNALSTSLTRDTRRGLAVSLNALSMRLPSSIGPTISGYLFDIGWLNIPLYITAVLQIVNAALYQKLFGSFDRQAPPSEKAQESESRQ